MFSRWTCNIAISLAFLSICYPYYPLRVQGLNCSHTPTQVDGVYYATAANGTVKKYDLANGASIFTVAATVPTTDVYGTSGWSMDGSTFFASSDDFSVSNIGVSPYEWIDANSTAPVAIDYARYFRPLRYYRPT